MSTHTHTHTTTAGRARLPLAPMPPPPWPRAADVSTLNPTCQQRRISELVRGAAETLCALGAKPSARLRVFYVEPQTSKEGAQ